MQGKWRATCGLLLCLALASFSPSHARSQSDHRLRYLTLETAHFRIHYHEPLGILARELASEAEAVNTKLEKALGLSLEQRVELVLADDDDGANGSATPLPYNAIRLRAASPDDMSPLADYDHWPTLLLIHEHTHILHLEHARGIPRLAQLLFGRFYTPQSYLPGWLTEGLAVVEESAQTHAGRLHSSQFDMFLRMDAIEGRILPLDLLGFDGEPWPHGNARYLYGSAFMQFIRLRHGEAALGHMVREYGKRLVPFGVNRALARATGETFSALYGAFTTELRTRAEAVRAAVEQRGRVEGRRLTFHGEMTRSPRFTRAGELVYAVWDARRPPEIRRLSLHEGAQPERVLRTGGVAALAPFAGGEQLLFSAFSVHRGVYGFDELSRVGRDGRGQRQLTFGMRAREPDVAPDGMRVAYVTQSAGTSHLEIAELADIERTRRVVVNSRRLSQVFTPRWSPDGRTIAYGAFERGGYRDLWLLDVASGVRKRLTYDRALDRGPVFAPDGKSLYFSSDRTGVANIYRYDLASGAIVQLTNVLAGAFQPAISPDGQLLVYVGYTSRGFDLYALPLAGVLPRAAEPSFTRAAAPALPAAAPLTSRRYAPLPTLYPRYYELTTEDTSAGARAVLTTSGSDPVGLHAWQLRATRELSQPDWGVELGYSYRQARLPAMIYGGLRDRERSDLVVSGRRRKWHAREGSVGLGSALFFPAPLYTVGFRLDYVLSFLQKAEPFSAELDPNQPRPRLPELGFDASTYWSATYNSAQRQPYDISRSYGQSVSVGGSWSEPWFGGRERDWTVGYRLEQYLRFAFRESVLALAYTGAHRAATSLGGLPARLVPLRDALLGKNQPSDYARLRGLVTREGSELAALQLEYRLLIARINRGYETLPLFARRVHAALFVDVGDAWSGRFSLQRLGVGVGGELRLDWATEYHIDHSWRFGLAHGLTEGAELQWYTTLANPF